MNERDSAGTGTDGFNSKTEYSNNRRVSIRTVTNWMAAGMPHLKCGPRKVLIETSKADEWLRNTFEVTLRPSDYQRRSKTGGAR